MTPKTEEFKAAMSIVRERIAAAKRRETHRGFIDNRGCISVTNEFISILGGAGKSAERGEFTYAYSVAALVLVNLAKLAGSADDSAGGITDARGYVDDVLEKVCSGVSYSSTDAEFIFLQSIKDSQNKAFDGWDEFAYDLLRPTARLATPKNVGKLYAALDEFSAKLSKRLIHRGTWSVTALFGLRLLRRLTVTRRRSVSLSVTSNMMVFGALPSNGLSAKGITQPPKRCASTR